MTAQTLTEHPYIDPGEIKTKTCLGCHPDKAEGKFVHSAVSSGCASCHQVASEKQKEKTTVTLMGQSSELCALCHEGKKDAVLHAPYKSGQCTVCHNPHSSDFPRQMRAATNTLCMSCHGVNQPNVKFNAGTKSVTLPGGQAFDLVAFERAPKIAAEHPASSKPPSAGHPLTGKVPRGGDAVLSCVSCHDPHSSQAAKLLRSATESGK